MMSKAIVKISANAKMVLKNKAKRAGLSQTDLAEYAIMDTDIETLLLRRRR